jgi:MFS family permease
VDRRERLFALTMGGVHGVDHLLKRLFPPLVPVWAAAFGYPLWKLGLAVGALTFGSAVGQAPLGHLSDRHDRRYVLPAGLVLLGLGVAGVGLLPGLLGAGNGVGLAVPLAGVSLEPRLLAMLAAMAAAGLGSAAVHPTGYPLITANVSADSRGRALGLWGGASKFGDGLAPAAVGLLLLVVGWRAVLVGFGSLAVLAAVALAVVLGGFETRPAGDESRDAATDDGDETRRYRGAFLAVFAYFVVAIAAAGGVTVFLPEFVADVYGVTAEIAGRTLGTTSTASLYYAGLLLFAGGVQLVTGHLVDRLDPRLVLLAFVALGATALTAVATLSLGPTALFAVLLALGVGLWGVNPARDALVSAVVPPALEGRAFGYVWTGSLLAAAGSAVAVGYVGDVAGLETAFLLLAGTVAVSGLPIALLLGDRLPTPTADRASADADADADAD